MKTGLVQTLTTAFEAHAQQTEGGVEYWLARDIQPCSATMNGETLPPSSPRQKPPVRFQVTPSRIILLASTKWLDVGSGSQREIEDSMLTRNACYIISVGNRAKGASTLQPRATPWELAHHNQQP